MFLSTREHTPQPEPGKPEPLTPIEWYVLCELVPLVGREYTYYQPGDTPLQAVANKYGLTIEQTLGVYHKALRKTQALIEALLTDAPNS